MFDNQNTVSHNLGEFALTRDSEANIKLGENGEISAASLPKLFEKLVFDKIDKWTFAYTFHLFAKPKQLLDQLQFRYLTPQVHTCIFIYRIPGFCTQSHGPRIRRTKSGAQMRRLSAWP